MGRSLTISCFFLYVLHLEQRSLGREEKSIQQSVASAACLWKEIVFIGNMRLDLFGVLVWESDGFVWMCRLRIDTCFYTLPFVFLQQLRTLTLSSEARLALVSLATEQSGGSSLGLRSWRRFFLVFCFVFCVLVGPSENLSIFVVRYFLDSLLAVVFA